MVKRIISAAIGIAIGVSILIFDNKIIYTAAISFFGAVGVWEIIHAVKCDKHRFLMWLCVVFAAVIPVLMNFRFEIPLKINIIAFCYLMFVFALLLIMLFDHKNIKFEMITMCGSAATVIPAALNCIVLVRYLPWYIDGGYLPGVFMIVYLLFCAWFGDSGAYFVGTFLGKHKLCPVVSPKKTVEGLIGGIITVGVAVGVQCLVYNLILPSEMKMSYLVLIPIGMLACGAGVLGDLTASVIKRQYDVKDFGNLMPGHGGVLDRFDSVIFVAPFLYTVFSFLSPIAGG